MSFDFQPFSGTTSTLQTATTADGSDDDSSYEPQPGDNNLAGMEMDIPKCVLHRISHLSQLHDKKGDIMEAYMAERAALEAKYMSLCSPLYEERRQVVVGELDSTIEEAAKRGVYPSFALDDKEEGATGLSANDDENTDGSKIVGCPQFWLVAMGHMDVISDVITEGDVDALEYIYDIKCLDKPDGTGFTIEFYFNSKTNPYFSNEKLTKTYSIPNLYMEDEPIIDDVKGCEIHWLDEEHCLTERSVTKKERSKGGKVSERSERALRKTRIRSTTELTLFHSIPRRRGRDRSEQSQRRSGSTASSGSLHRPRCRMWTRIWRRRRRRRWKKRSIWITMWRRLSGRICAGTPFCGLLGKLRTTRKRIVMKRGRRMRRRRRRTRGGLRRTGRATRLGLRSLSSQLLLRPRASSRNAKTHK